MDHGITAKRSTRGFRNTKGGSRLAREPPRVGGREDPDPTDVAAAEPVQEPYSDGTSCRSHARPRCGKGNLCQGGRSMLWIDPYYRFDRWEYVSGHWRRLPTYPD
jgi:hypothetical protein